MIPVRVPPSQSPSHHGQQPGPTPETAPCSQSPPRPVGVVEEAATAVHPASSINREPYHYPS